MNANAALEGKIAFVTGGSRGIGAAIAQQLALAGASVALTYLKGKEKAEQVVRSIETSNGKALAIQMDSENPVAIENAITTVVQKFGKIDILVNNIGILHSGPIHALSAEDFDKTMASNVRSVFVAIKAVLPVMPNGGRIISIGSSLADRAFTAGASLYITSKAALQGLTRALARELGAREITVNIVQPGSTNTDMNPADSPTASAKIARMAIPSRFISPNEIAHAVVFLASPSSASITGIALTVDNGANV